MYIGQHCKLWYVTVTLILVPLIFIYMRYVWDWGTNLVFIIYPWPQYLDKSDKRLIRNISNCSVAWIPTATNKYQPNGEIENIVSLWFYRIMGFKEYIVILLGTTLLNTLAARVAKPSSEDFPRKHYCLVILEMNVFCVPREMWLKCKTKL